MNALALFLTGWLLAAVAMLLTFRAAWRRNNAGIVDVVWAYALGGLALYYLLAGSFDIGLRQVAVAGLVLFWSLRLGGYLAKRVASEEEDGRYQQETSPFFPWFSKTQAPGTPISSSTRTS